MESPRKDPIKIRRSSKKEFSRVTSLLQAQIKALEYRVAILEGQAEDKPESEVKKRRRATKPKEESIEE